MSDETIVVVPCYNEAARLDVPAYERFLRCANAASLLFVDDGSTDDTPRVLEALRERHPMRVSVFRAARNGGKAEAVRRGMLLAARRRPEFVGYWDADLATPLDAIDRFRDVLATRPELLLAMGSRVPLLGHAIHRRRTRQWLGRTFAAAASLALGLRVFDTQCGAKLFRATSEVIALFQAPFQSRWIFDVEILARLQRVPDAAGALYELPLDRWQDVAGSRLRPRDFLIAAVDLAAIGWRYRRGSTPTVTTMPVDQPRARRKAA